MTIKKKYTTFLEEFFPKELKFRSQLFKKLCIIISVNQNICETIELSPMSEN